MMKTRTITLRMDPKKLAPIMAPRTDKEYEERVELLNRLVEEIGDHPENPRYRLIETLSALIESYDAEHHPVWDAPGIEVLRFLMEEHGLSQSDLPEVGTQGVISELLSGDRELNLRQVQALAARFGVDPGAFISTPSRAATADVRGPRPRLRMTVRAPRLTTRP